MTTEHNRREGYMPTFDNPHAALRHHVTGAVQRGEDPIVEIPTLELACERATAIGAEHGTGAGTWIFDGNSDYASMRAFLAGIDDGDPAVYDALPSAPLSGEWADGYMLSDLASDTGITEDDDAFDDVCTAYETAWQDAMIAEACRYAHAVLPDAV